MSCIKDGEGLGAQACAASGFKLVVKEAGEKVHMPGYA